MSDRPPDGWELAHLRRLTYDEMRAGERCWGCGVPLLTDEESERPCFCRASRWRMAGQGSEHCSNCCPPPPISPEIAARVNSLLASALRTRVTTPPPPKPEGWQQLRLRLPK